MTDADKTMNWQTSTWEGSRRAQLRAALRLTVRQRLEALESLGETSRHFAQLREAGAFHYGGENMQADKGARHAIAEPGKKYAPDNGSGKYRVHLQGCRPTPLASYLKALAIHRLVAEQKDPEARGWWQGEHFVLESWLDEEGLKRFFLEEYQPTPIIAPWNGGSGFYPKDNKAGISVLAQCEQPRFQEYLKSISIGEKAVSALALTESPKDKELKSKLILCLRAELPDRALSWMDAALMLTSGDVKFPPLLGTGGNDGRLDFTNNFMQRLVDVFNLPDMAGNSLFAAHLDECLFCNAHPFMAGKKAIGQFSPGQAGGPNASTGYEADSLTNPWDFILMIEGALLFAAAATRRLGNEEPGALAFPFTVRPKGSGQGGLNPTDEPQARAEIWLPLWDKPASLAGLKGLFTEGRVTLGRRTVKDGLDFARSLGLLAADRGISSFQRYAFMMRSGKAYLATPLNRFRVPRKPQQDLVSELDQWLWRLQAWARGDNASNRIKSLSHRLENALFDLAGATGKRTTQAQKALILLGEIQRYAGTSPATREKLPPLPLLSERWFLEARDNTHEFRLASALAGLQSGDEKHPLPFRVHLSPTDPRQKQRDWLPEGAKHHYRTWHHGGLEDNLTAVLEKRLLLATQQGFADKPLDGWPPADLASIVTFLSGATDDRRIAGLLGGLAYCGVPRHVTGETAEAVVIPAAFAVLKLILTSERQLRRCGLLAGDEHLPVPPGIVRLLTAGRVDEAIRLAHRRLHIAGLCPLPVAPRSAGVTGGRLAAALLIPLEDRAIRFLHKTLSGYAGKQVS